MLSSDCVEGSEKRRKLRGREDVRGRESSGMSLAGCDLFFEEAPVKDDGALPLFEFLVERLAEPA